MTLRYLCVSTYGISAGRPLALYLAWHSAVQRLNRAARHRILRVCLPLALAALAAAGRNVPRWAASGAVTATCSVCLPAPHRTALLTYAAYLRRHALKTSLARVPGRFLFAWAARITPHYAKPPAARSGRVPGAQTRRNAESGRWAKGMVTLRCRLLISNGWA